MSSSHQKSNYNSRVSTIKYNDARLGFLEEYLIREEEIPPKVALTVLTEAYMYHHDSNAVFRTLIYAAGNYWMSRFERLGDILSGIAHKHSFAYMMPLLSEKFNNNKELYGDFDLKSIYIDDAIAAARELILNSDDESFRISFAIGIYQYFYLVKTIEGLGYNNTL